MDQNLSAKNKDIQAKVMAELRKRWQDEICISLKNQKGPLGLFFAETEGFEPSIPFGGIHTFQACSFNHSDKSPWGCKNKCIRSEAEDFFGVCCCDGVDFLSTDAF